MKRASFSGFETYLNQDSESKCLSIQQSDAFDIELGIPQDQFIAWTTLEGKKYYFYRSPGRPTFSGENGEVSELSLIAEDKLKSVPGFEPMVIKKGVVKSDDLPQLQAEVDTFKKVYAGKAKLFYREKEGGVYDYLIVMKKIPGVRLDSYLLDHPELSDEVKIRILLAVLSALAELHTKHKTVQVDLTCKNVHIVEKGGEYKAYLLDFGLAQTIPNNTLGPNYDLYILLSDLFGNFDFNYIFNDPTFLGLLKSSPTYTAEEMIKRVQSAQGLLKSGVAITLPFGDSIFPTSAAACVRKYGLILVAFGLCAGSGHFLAGGLSLTNPLGWVGLGVGAVSVFILIKLMQRKERRLEGAFALFFTQDPETRLPFSKSDLPPLPEKG